MKLRDLQDRIVDKYENFDDITEHRGVPDVIRDIVRDVVDGLGLVVGPQGDIGDPAPKPMPRQAGVHWSGGRHRRGRR